MLRRSRRSGTSSQNKKGSQVEIPLKSSDRKQQAVINPFNENDANKANIKEQSKALMR